MLCNDPGRPARFKTKGRGVGITISGPPVSLQIASNNCLQSQILLPKHQEIDAHPPLPKKVQSWSKISKMNRFIFSTEDYLIPNSATILHWQYGVNSSKDLIFSGCNVRGSSATKRRREGISNLEKNKNFPVRYWMPEVGCWTIPGRWYLTCFARPL